MTIFHTKRVRKAGNYLLINKVLSGLYLSLTILSLATLVFASFTTLSFLRSTFDKVLFTTEEAGASIPAFNLVLFETLALRFEIVALGTTAPASQGPAASSTEQSPHAPATTASSSIKGDVDN